MNFKFFNGKITLQEFLTQHGYNNMMDLENVCDYFDNMEWYEQVVKTFNYKKEEDIEYQEFIRTYDESRLNPPAPIEDEDDLPI